MHLSLGTHQRSLLKCRQSQKKDKYLGSFFYQYTAIVYVLSVQFIKLIFLLFQ